jgi:transcriptional regulator with XRE-family HTH domain
MAKPTISLDEAIGHHGNIVKYYRCAVMNQPRGWTQEQLAEAMNVSTRWVQEIEKMEYIQDINRRKALAIILGIPTTLLDIKKIERLYDYSTIRLKPTILKRFENSVRSRWKIYYSSSNQVTEEGLIEQLDILEQLADNGGGDTQRIARLLSQSCQLAGTLARDDFKYSRAKKYFREALDFAKEAQSSDLIATSVARHALVLLRQGHDGDALHMYNEAVDLAKNAQPLVRAYIDTGLAEAQARNGLQDDCLHTLDTAEKLLDNAGNVSSEDDIAFVRLTLQSLQDDRGECYVLSGKPLKGIEHLQKAEKKLDRNLSRNHCRLLMQQAEAFLAAQDPGTCVEYTIKGLQIARTLGSPGNINWANEIHDKLLVSQWKYEPIVGKLGAAIVMY